MSAERFVEINEPRLVERSDQTARVRNRALHSGAVVRISAQISRTQFMSGEHRSAAAKIEDQVAGRGRAISRRAEHELGPRGGQWQRVVVDRQLEAAEMTAGVADRTLEHGKFIDPARRDVPGL